MSRDKLDEMMAALRKDVLHLGDMVEEALQGVLVALETQDIEAARVIFYRDIVLNRKRFAIEQDTMVTIATQGPMAHDLRFLAAVVEITTDLERMGDYAKGIARITVNAAGQLDQMPLGAIPRMVEINLDILRQALQAFNHEDVVAARKIPDRDEEIDLLYQQAYRTMVLASTAEPREIERQNKILNIAHKLERFADRVTNICERVIFMATGNLDELDMEDEARKLLH